MGIYLRNGNVFNGRQWEQRDVILEGGRIAALLPSQERVFAGSGVSAFEIAGVSNDTDIFIERVIQCDNSFLLPGMVDVHVHFREPGMEYKETIASGSRAAAAGGYTTVCTMPNVSPPPTDFGSLQIQLAAIQKDACIPVIPYGAITSCQNGTGMLSAMATMADQVVAFSDDGVGIQEAALMEAAMKKAAALGKVIAAHCESNHYAALGDPRRSEWTQVERDLGLCEKTGCAYHVCHVSTAESVNLIRAAKKANINVTCETAPHYLLFTAADRLDQGNYKMNPPLMDAADRAALLEGLKDGTIDMIATDHAPHSKEEKSLGFQGSANGVVGLETAFPVLYTHLVLTGKLSLRRLLEAMCLAPRQRFGLDGQTVSQEGKATRQVQGIEKVEDLLRPGAPANLSIWDLETKYRVDPEQFQTKGRSTPFEGMEVSASCQYTIAGGNIIWEK